MAQPETSISLILTDHLAAQNLLPASETGFRSVFALKSRSPNAATKAVLISEDAVGASTLRRLEYFATPEQLPYLIAPLLIRHLWSRDDVRDVVIAYPGLPWERLLAAGEMLKSCQAVVVRSEGTTPIVAALSRSRRNERLAEHWADCVERFSSDCRQSSGFDVHIGGQIVEALCDRLGSIRYAWPPVPAKESTPEDAFQQRVQEEIRKLLATHPQLLEDPAKHSVQVLNLPAPGIDQDPGNLITHFMSLIWAGREDLREAFDLENPESRRGFVDWCLGRSAIEHAVTDAFLAPIRAERRLPSRSATTSNRAKPEPVEPFGGVNLIGYPRAEMGMGEQLRGCAAALTTTSFQVSIRDFNFGIVASQQDSRFDHLIQENNPYRLNIFHVNADQMPLAWEKLTPKFFRDHYNIAYWEWELSNFPDKWHSSIDLVDEIWAPSKFIQQAVAKATTKPVIWMPLAVEFSKPAGRFFDKGIRARLGLPEKDFLFLFTFDFSSLSARKNFSGCIRAFREAFNGTQQRVGLVLKTNRRPHQLREFWELLDEVGDDPQIHVVDRVLRQREMRELVSDCDAYVSLHRSEGFGLGIAEAMYLGKPVIATNYSGNVDFAKEDNCCLVDYELIPVKEGEYPFWQGQVWAEPDVAQAAAYMRRLVEDSEYGKRIGAAASSFIRQQHSWSVIGARYADRIKQIEAATAMLSGKTEPEEYSLAVPNEGRLKSFVKRLL